MSSRHLSIEAEGGGIQMPERHCDICGVYTADKCSTWTRSNCKNRNQGQAEPAPATSSWTLFWFVLILTLIIVFAIS